MDRLHAMRVFVAVADHAGFAAAARRLALSPPAATRAVSSLEDAIGTRLLHRTTRQVRLTEAGERYLADCRRILAEIAEAEASAAGAHGEARGGLAVTAPALFGRLFVAPVVLGFLERHPQVSVRTLLVDRVVDLLDEGIDVAVRIAHLADSEATAVRVGAVRRVVCAAPGYLARRGAPRTPADVAGHDAIAFAGGDAAPAWTFAGGELARPRARLLVNTADVAIAAAVAGHGLTQVLSYQVADEVAAGRLRIVLAEREIPPVPVHVVHLAGRRAAARVRAFVDFAVERLRADPVLARATAIGARRAPRRR